MVSDPALVATLTITGLADRAKTSETTVIRFFPKSPLAEMADLVLTTTAAGETTFRSGAMSSRLAQLIVVDCLFVAVAQRSYAETGAALEST